MFRCGEDPVRGLGEALDRAIDASPITLASKNRNNVGPVMQPVITVVTGKMVLDKTQRFGYSNACRRYLRGAGDSS